MIPSLPETISGTHVEYFPLSAAFLASAFINSYSSYYRMGASDGSCSMRVSDSNGKPSSKESSTKTPPPSTALSHYFRGCDLHYAPNTHVPAAQSVQNCLTSDVADVKTFVSSNETQNGLTSYSFDWWHADIENEVDHIDLLKRSEKIDVYFKWGNRSILKKIDRDRHSILMSGGMVYEGISFTPHHQSKEYDVSSFSCGTEYIKLIAE